IQYLAAKISECISLRFYPETVHDYFIGHIGGDDFICIIDGHGVEIVCESIIDSFNNGIPHFYSKNDVENGFIISRNRKGTEENFGLASLSIAGVSNKKRSYKDIYELSELSSRIKKKCKEQGGNCYIIE
ncbi:MAG: diguanylate cyclase, partial [Clostridiales bacterium]|nr:diguanylate cyclase [Clostridiales bacterium]